MIILKELKHRFLNRKGLLDKPTINTTTEEASKMIWDCLTSPNPTMIGRLGAFELGVAISAKTPLNLHNIYRFIKGEIVTLGWNDRTSAYFCNNAGFFPNDRTLFRQFGDLMTKDLPECDLLASFSAGEKFFESQLSNAKKIKPFDLEPFHHQSPWTKALEGKRVLVIHPYEDSIRHQWAVRDRLFPTRDYLPEFDLQIIKAVQSAAGNKSEFKTWFEALDHMKSEIDKRDFDIALIGCGAYGFHLAAHVKRTGKKAIHLGGLLQILFGIMGKRWEGKYPFVNEHWIRPLPSDMIQNAKSIENGCYW